MVGWTEKTDHISLSEVGKACKSYVMLLGYGARRGVNNTTLKWDRPSRCLVTNILGRKTRQTWPAFQKEIGAGLEKAQLELVASRKYAKRQGQAKQSTSGALDNTGSISVPDSTGV